MCGQPTDPDCTLSDEAMMAIVASTNDERAFGELIHRWERTILRVCRRVTGNREDAEDAVQDAFSRAFRARHQFRSTSRFSTWLWRIAVNAACDSVRRRNNARAGQVEGSTLADRSAGPLETSIAGERDRIVRDAILKLSAEHRAVLILRHYERLKLREIAEVLDIPAGTVASRMAEALNKIELLLPRDLKDET